MENISIYHFEKVHFEINNTIAATLLYNIIAIAFDAFNTIVSNQY